MENGKTVVIEIKCLCMSFILINAVLADDSVRCGLTRCNRPGYDFCVRPPLVSTEDDSYCLSCKTKEDKCGTSDQQAGCQPFCKEYLMLNWGCTNNSFITAEDYRLRNDKTICLDLWIVIVFLVLFGCVSLFAGVLLWRIGWIQALCTVFYMSYMCTRSKDIRPIPPETEPLNNPNRDDYFITQNETTTLKTTAGAISSTTENDTTRNSSNRVKTSARASSSKYENNNSSKTKKTADASSSTTINHVTSFNNNVIYTTADASSSTSGNDTASNKGKNTDVSKEFKGPSNVSPTNHGDNLDKNFAIG